MRPVFFLNRYAWPDDSATAQLLTDLTRDQAARGHKVTILTSRQRYRDAHAQLPSRDEDHGVSIVRLWSTAFGRDHLWGRAFDYLSFYLSAFLFLLFRLPRRALLVSLTDPPLITIITALPCWLKGTRQIHWSQDVFPEIVSAVQAPGKGARIALNLLEALRNLSLRGGVHVAAIGEDMRRHYAAHGVPPERIHVLPNWSSGDTVFPVPPSENPLRREWGLEDAFVLGYSGNLGRVHDYKTFIGAAEILLETVPPLRFLFIGSGALHQRLQEELPAEIRERTVFQPYQDRALLSQSLSVPDLHWISLQPACTPLVFPSKFYGVIAAGRPSLFVGDPQSELARLIQAHEIGTAVEQGDSASFARVVKHLADEPEQVERMGCAARKLFETHYNQPLAQSQWDALLSRLADRRA
jgi:colanic acid biosynthesis glycosyl transferase WcaI